MSASGTHSNTTITYPIAFDTQCYSVASTREGTSPDGTWNAVISNLTTTTFLCQLKIGLYWLAVGKQQWGILTQDSQETCTFPIALNQVLCCFCIAHAPNTNNSSYVYGGRIKSYTTTTITTFVNSYRQSISGWWLVFGKQQWGSTTSNNMALPISFSTVFGGVGARYTTSGYSGINSITTDKVTFGYERSSFIAVGKQQWGLYQQPGVVNHTVSFPIAFPSACWCCVNTCGYTSTSGAQAYGVYSRSKTQFVSTGYGCGTSNTTYVAIGNQQWGVGKNADYGPNTSVSVNYPISFPNTVLSIIPTLTGSYANATIIYPKSYTVNNVVFCVDEWSGVTQTAKPMFITIGIQKQWGTIKITSRNKLTFPLTFTTNCYAVTSIVIIDNYYVCSVYNITKADCYVRIWQSASGGGPTMDIFFIALGNQQWRFLEATASKNTWIYPIAFSNFVIPVTTRYYTHSDEQSTQEMAIAAYNLTSCTIIRGTNYTKGIFCYALGVQQWGEGSYVTYTFPITFTNTLYAFISQMNINFANSHYERNNYVYTKTNSKITLGTDNINRFWTAIGY